jgi:type IV pilus assembly protein PilB
MPQTSQLDEQLKKIRREGEEREAERRAQRMGYPYVDLRKTPVSVEALKLIPEGDARKAKAASIEVRVRKVAVAAFDPSIPEAQEIIKNLEGKKYEVKIFVASLSGLEEVWQSYRFVKPEAEEITGKVSISAVELEKLIGKLNSLSAVQKEIENFDFTKITPTLFLNTILAGALSLKSSDIHLESEEKQNKIRFRVDGLLHDVFNAIPLKNYNSLVSRIKLLSGMKINVRGESQDGRFTVSLGTKEIEMRVSVIPAEFGENIVMRVLDPSVTSLGLPDLGLREDDLKIAERQIKKPNGLILNTGPTGSGKTTTLYAFLRSINSPEIKIITLEDPIEYRLKGVEQTQVDEEVGYTFGNGLRAIVRQDPDVILVGEIRDLETADIAVQASLTGHLVLSTLHTNDAVGAVPRLINLGVKPASVGPALTLVIAQRLVRRLCPNCRKEVKMSADLEAKIKKFFDNLPKRVDRSKYENYKIYESGGGCEKCGGFGYRGRIGIFEFLEGGAELEELILKEVSEVSLKKLAKDQGMVTMQEDGILKVLTGQTSLDEVEGVTGEIEW